MRFGYASVPFIPLFLFTILNSFPDYSGIICKVLLGVAYAFYRYVSDATRHACFPESTKTRDSPELWATFSPIILSKHPERVLQVSFFCAIGGKKPISVSKTLLFSVFTTQSVLK